MVSSDSDNRSDDGSRRSGTISIGIGIGISIIIPTITIIMRVLVAAATRALGVCATAINFVLPNWERHAERQFFIITTSSIIHRR